MRTSSRIGVLRVLKAFAALAGFLCLAVGIARSGTFEDQARRASEELGTEAKAVQAKIRASQTAEMPSGLTELKSAPAGSDAHGFRDCWGAGDGYSACRADGR